MRASRSSVRNRIAALLMLTAAVFGCLACGRASTTVESSAQPQDGGSASTADAAVASPREGTQSVSDREAADAVHYAVLSAPTLPGWSHQDRQLVTYALEQLNGEPRDVTWVVDSYRPEGTADPESLAGVQFNQAPLPEDPMTRALPSEQLPNGLTVYIGAPPEGVAQGGSVTWFTDDARYTLASTVLRVDQLTDVVSAMNLQPLGA